MDIETDERFYTWYWNGCTSGIATREELIQRFESLPPEEQNSLREEYNNLLNLLKEQPSYWAGPFEG